mmetsp:Transcript_22076/g.68793  ORF Transcript_22076/g.68793 Transcript_22076/m.68793 type:complete len:200 (-) Transcript_22076:3575-4174(-)
MAIMSTAAWCSPARKAVAGAVAAGAAQGVAAGAAVAHLVELARRTGWHSDRTVRATAAMTGAPRVRRPVATLASAHRVEAGVGVPKAGPRRIARRSSRGQQRSAAWRRSSRRPRQSSSASSRRSRPSWTPTRSTSAWPSPRSRTSAQRSRAPRLTRMGTLWSASTRASTCSPTTSARTKTRRGGTRRACCACTTTISWT